MGAFHHGQYSGRDSDGDFWKPRASVMARMEIPPTTMGINFPCHICRATLLRISEYPSAFCDGVV